MALDINTNYPTQTLPPDAEYPRGRAKNVSTPNAADGTPWNANVIDNWIGFFQGLLSRAGINPNGYADVAVPDTSNPNSLSQYIEALGNICGRAEETTAGILALDMVGAEYIVTNGYASAGDGGGAVWFATGTTTPGSAGTTDFDAARIYDAVGTEFELAPGLRNPRQFGAAGDGVTDDTAAVLACAASLPDGGVIYSPAGVYLVAEQVTLNTGTVLRGEGPTRSVWSFDGAADVSFPDGYCVFAEGSVAAIADLAGDIAAGVGSITFTGAHGLAFDDVFLMLDPTNGSLNTAQTYYRQGEFVRVAAVSSATEVECARATFAAYTAASTDLAKLTPARVGVEDMGIVGPGSTTAVGLFGVSLGRECFARRVKLSGTQARAMLAFDRCFDVEASDVDGLDMTNVAAGLRHVVGVWNTQGATLTRLRGSSGESFAEIGGIDSAWAPPARLVALRDSHIDDTRQGSLSVLINGGAEWWTVQGCTLAGLWMGGDLGTVTGCTVYSTGPGGGFDVGRAIGLDEAHGLDFMLAGCRFLATTGPGPNVGLVHLDDASAALDRAGTITLDGCRFDMQGFGGLPLRAVCRSVLGGAEPSIEIAGCTVDGGSQVNISTAVNGASWKRVRVRASSFQGVGLVIQGAEDVDIVACQVFDSPVDGIAVNGTSFANYAAQRVMVSACNVRGSQFAGIELGDTTVTALVAAQVLNCVSINNNQSGATGATGLSYASVRADTVASLIMMGNVFGDDQGSSTQLASYSLEDSTANVVNTVVIDDALAPDITGGGSHRAWGTRNTNDDEHRSTGALFLAGATAAEAASGAADLVIGDGVGNVGMTLRAPAAGVSRVALGDSGDDNRFEIRGDHSGQALDFYSGGGRDLRLLSDAAELGRVYSDETDGAGSFVVNIWATGSTTSETSVGGPFASRHLVTQAGASGAVSGQLTYTFPEAYDQIPQVFLQGVGVEASGWTLSTVSTTTAIVLFNGNLTIADVTGFNLLVVGRRN